ncbi:MAG TPA: alpha/beta fold hydrolase [Pseudolysinimonas sp.]|nr:alpha/beta fold hydrolase [Pseudolysinimonas sp.]
MHPPIEPYMSATLAGPGGGALYWEESGSPEGTPALYLHGGPGGGLGRGGYRRHFDPARYRVIGLDQRGCGRSEPWAIDALDTLDDNTTQTLIADIEALREHLGIDSWLVHGVSWGSTLALAYALAHPARVSAIVVMAVTTSSRAELDWITSAMGRVFPEAWAEVEALAGPGERPLDACARLLRTGTTEARQRVADIWDRWEATHISLDPNVRPGPLHDDARMRLNFATLVTHYWAHDCFVDGIIGRAGELRGIPGVLVHGRLDLSGPAVTPWTLHRNWPGSRLVIVETEGHGGPEMAQIAADAIAEFA